MADIFEIAGRIHSTSQEHVTSPADEILDTSQNKKQHLINADVARHESEINSPTNGLNKRVADIEALGQIGDTPVETNASNIISNTSLNGKVSSASAVNGVYNAVVANVGYYTCDSEASTAAKVVEASGYVLTVGGCIKIKMTNANSANNATLNINSTGAKALYYDGERASANNTWEAGETVEVYYDGTNFYANNVAGGSGSGDGAFDVSAKYPTSGVEGGNTYTLEGALAVLNANLSASKKKGGMSIKFIQSFDNKYVQFRCMSDEFTTNVANWQGVDDEPTAGSVNLAESGGINKFVAEVNSIGKKELNLAFYSTTTKNGYKLNSDGTIKAQTDQWISSYSTIYTNTPVSKNSILVFTGTCETSNKVFSIGISSVPITDENITSVQITILSCKGYPVGDMSETIVVPFDGYIVYYRFTTHWTNVTAKIKNVPILLDNSALDVSELNNTNYNSLSNAIAAIPETLQKGGMEIRFKQFTPATYTVVKTEGVEIQPSGTEVQEALNLESGTYTAAQMTSVTPPESGSVTYYLTVTVDETTTYTTWMITKATNDSTKYVQYRYMETVTTAATFTNVANWQGVDDEPTAGSENLVKSGGVNIFVADNLKLLSKKIEGLPAVNYSINSTGLFGTSTTNKHTYFDVKPGEKYIVNCPSDKSYARIAFATSAEFSSGGQVPIVNGTNFIIVNHGKSGLITIPEGCSYVLIYVSSPNGPFNVWKFHFDGDDFPTEDSTNFVKSGGVYSALAAANTVTMSAIKNLSLEITDFISVNGSIQANGTYGRYTTSGHGYIAVNEGEKYIFENEGTNTRRYAFATSSEYTLGGNIPLVEGTTVYNIKGSTALIITIPAGCSFLVFDSKGFSTKIYNYLDRIDSLVSNGVPNYFEEQVEDVIAKASEDIANVGQDGENVIFITDSHYERNKHHSPALIKYICSKMSVSNIIHGGDYIDGCSTSEEARTVLGKVAQSLSATNSHYVGVFGNHDGNKLGNGEETGGFADYEKTFYAMAQKGDDYRAVEYTGHLYYYFDNKKTNTRYIILRTENGSTNTAEQKNKLYL